MRVRVLEQTDQEAFVKAYEAAGMAPPVGFLMAVVADDGDEPVLFVPFRAAVQVGDLVKAVGTPHNPLKAAAAFMAEITREVPAFKVSGGERCDRRMEYTARLLGRGGNVTAGFVDKEAAPAVGV